MRSTYLVPLLESVSSRPCQHLCARLCLRTLEGDNSHCLGGPTWSCGNDYRVGESYCPFAGPTLFKKVPRSTPPISYNYRQPSHWAACLALPALKQANRPVFLFALAPLRHTGTDCQTSSLSNRSCRREKQSVYQQPSTCGRYTWTDASYVFLS